MLPPKMVRELFLKSSLKLRLGQGKILEKHEPQLFGSILKICPHTRARACSVASPRLAKPSQSEMWLAWHDMVWYGVLARCHMIG